MSADDPVDDGPAEKLKEQYVGDGVYAVATDGMTIRLRTEREGGVDHFIYVDPRILRNLNRIAKDIGW